MNNKAIYFTIVLSGILGSLYFYTSHEDKNITVAQEITTPKRRKFIQNKLWRDHAATQLEERDGAIIHRVTLDDAEYNKQLGLKLMEEASEVAVATTKDEILSEIGDVLEVIDCLCKFHDISLDDVRTAQHKKRADRGSYVNREFVIMSEYLPNSFGEQYSLRDPLKYIEIID